MENQGNFACADASVCKVLTGIIWHVMCLMCFASLAGMPREVAWHSMSTHELDNAR